MNFRFMKVAFLACGDLKVAFLNLRVMKVAFLNHRSPQGVAALTST